MWADGQSSKTYSAEGWGTVIETIESYKDSGSYRYATVRAMGAVSGLSHVTFQRVSGGWVESFRCDLTRVE